MQSRNLLLQFVVTLAAVGVALLAYDYFRQPEIDAARQQTAALASQAQQLGDQATALKNQVAEQRSKEEARKQKFLTASYRAEGLQVAASAKVAVVESYFNTGKLPSSNAEVGMSAPDEFQTQSLRSMRIGDGGVITLTYDAKSGVDGGIIQLVPDLDNTYNIQWKCTSPDFRDIAETIPQCSYQAG